MKRYRVLSLDFDIRVSALNVKIDDNWDEEAKSFHNEHKNQIKQSVLIEYGQLESDIKINNFKELGAKPMSILAFHNKFYEQIRKAFIIGAYYPALTAACSLGERILNHLILLLREDYKSTPEYKKVYRKESFDDWNFPISTLESWGILLTDVVKNFQLLKDIRNKSIHFRPETDMNDRKLALEAISYLKEIIFNQFSAWGTQPWFIVDTPGEIYIKKDWESEPFIKKIYLPNCLLVGPRHTIESLTPNVTVNDDYKYENKIVTDEEFVKLRKQFKK